jgi:hypothetical protein
MNVSAMSGEDVGIGEGGRKNQASGRSRAEAKPIRAVPHSITTCRCKLFIALVSLPPKCRYTTRPAQTVPIQMDHTPCFIELFDVSDTARALWLRAIDLIGSLL